ncbi:MFS transporter [Streptosporangium lutulentum]|uniref:EmrB/QacA subfamily drug resistance transporter n=1 Tax=Streptosporangium lutulentum TaxID=1461250 RepID=A0ABT9Q9M6_9ACTN|nr:MFS transporter [Streptosporangium lutulentum]MDP9843450.1 EmrB/QacA subfamily drug resistance transporter [Streptosporangium lutulentum]
MNPPETINPAQAGRARAILGLVIAGTALVVIDMTIVTIGLPEIQAELGGTLAGVQWVIVGYMITMGAVTQVAGSLSDRMGRRRIYLLGIVVFTIASIACGVAPNTVLLDLARALQGIGGAILMVNALPLLSHQFEGERRNMAISTWGTAATAASLAAPLLGGVLVDALSWRAIFLINVPIGVAALLIGLRTLPADAPAGHERGRTDWAGAVLLITALALATFALLRGEQQGWGSATTLAQFTVAVILFIVFLRLESRADASILDVKLFRKPAFTGAALAVFMSRVLTIGGTVYFVQYFQGSLHLSPTQSGLLLMPVFLAQMAAGMLGGKLLSRFPSGYVIATGYACKAVGAALLALAFTPTIQPWLLTLPLLIWGIGGGIAGAPVMAVAMNVTDKDRAGMVAGTITSLASIGAGIGTAVLGLVYQTRIAGALATDSALPDGPRDAVLAAAANGDIQRIMELTPLETRTAVGHALATAIASGASAVLYCSAGLAAVTMAAVLILISKRNLPTPDKGRKPAAGTDPAPAGDRG